MNKRIIAWITGCLFILHTAVVGAAGFPFQPNQVLNAADLNNALQTAAITSGTIDSVTMTNSVIRSTAGTFTSLTSPSVSLTGGLIDNTPIGTTIPNAGTFTTATATSGVFGAATVSGVLTSNGSITGAGFSNYLASPPTIGGTAPNAGTFTTATATSGVFGAATVSGVLTSNGSITGVGFSNYLASPPAIGGTAPNAGTFTTATATSGVLATGSYSGSFTDGIVADYTAGNGRISVGVGDTITLYASGVANTQIAQFSSTGLSVTGTISATGGLATTATTKLPVLSATVATNAMTVGASSIPLDFRSATLGSGAISTITAAPSNLVIPASATLGTVNAVQSRIIVAEMNNGGTAELAVANVSGGLQMDETNLISTTAISSSATASGVWYSTTGRSNLPYRIVGYIESTQASAGAWSTAPSTIQGAGGNAVTAMSSIGYGQTWQTVTRTSGTTYYNTTGKPITLRVVGVSSAGAGTTINYSAVIGGVTLPTSTYSSISASQGACETYMIPPGMSYVVTITVGTGTPSIQSAEELR